jgi:hypothetical protein
MAEIIDFGARRRRILHMRAGRRLATFHSPIERYKRAYLNWQLNPTPGTEAERLNALLAVLEAREQRI